MEGEHQRADDFFAEWRKFPIWEYFGCLKNSLISIEIDKVEWKNPGHLRSGDQRLEPNARFRIEAETPYQEFKEFERFNLAVGNNELCIEDDAAG